MVDDIAIVRGFAWPVKAQRPHAPNKESKSSITSDPIRNQAAFSPRLLLPPPAHSPAPSPNKRVLDFRQKRKETKTGRSQLGDFQRQMQASCPRPISPLFLPLSLSPPPLSPLLLRAAAPACPHHLRRKKERIRYNKQTKRFRIFPRACRSHGRGFQPCHQVRKEH